MDLLQELNPAQAKAVQADHGPVLVLAGPGSGKTRVLTYRIAYLIGTQGVSPYRILAVTFTNKAAREMATRLQALIGPDADKLTIGTFHATCVRILRREAPHIAIDRNFVIYDADDQQRLVQRIIKALNLDTKQYRPSAVHNAISNAKNDLITAEAYTPPTYWHEAVARVYARYEERKAANNALDFDDLLLKTEQLFRENEDVRHRYQQRYQHVLVDEFQDTNKAQYELVKHLVPEGGSVFVVGDEDQSIYSWRGADFRNVIRFRRDFEQAQLYLLERNYRSTQTILDAAQHVIAHNSQRTDKKLWTENDAGEPIRILEAYDEREEAEFVVKELQHLVERGVCSYGDAAVMFRTNAQSRELEEALLDRGIPYQLVGGTRFYQRREVKDVVSYLRVVQNPDDDVSLTRIINVPSRGIGAKTLAALQRWCRSQGLSLGRGLLRLAEIVENPQTRERLPFSTRARHRLADFAHILAHLMEIKREAPLSELLDRVLAETDYVEYLRDGTQQGQDRIDNVRELFSAVQRHDQLNGQEALPSFLEQVALVSDMDQLNWQSDAVTLLTLHSAKGLEFEAVFLVGMEEGICPHSRSMDDPDQMEEERRLAYVGITRAKRHLYLLHTFRRSLYGRSELKEPSRFLRAIPAHLARGHIVAQTSGASSTWGSKDGSASQPQEDREPEFHPGERVRHHVFGIGTVVSSKLVGNDEEVTVAFADEGVKRLMNQYAHLEKA